MGVRTAQKLAEATNQGLSFCSVNCLNLSYGESDNANSAVSYQQLWRRISAKNSKKIFFQVFKNYYPTPNFFIDQAIGIFFRTPKHKLLQVQNSLAYLETKMPQNTRGDMLISWELASASLSGPPLGCGFRPPYSFLGCIRHRPALTSTWLGLFPVPAVGQIPSG